RLRLPMPLPLCRHSPAFAPGMGLPPTPRSQLSGNPFGWPTTWSSLLFSCTGVDSLVHLSLHGFPKRVLADFVEGHSIHGNLFYSPVVQLIAFTQEIGPRLRVRHHRDHPRRRAHNSVQPKRADLQSRLARRKWSRRRTASSAMSDQRLKRISARYSIFF